jgi:hypothetical protein
MTNDNTERFERLIAALERELIEATDEEILEAARDLRMDPLMKGSAAFIDLTIARLLPMRSDDSMKSERPPRSRRRPKDKPPR